MVLFATTPGSAAISLVSLAIFSSVMGLNIPFFIDDTDDDGVFDAEYIFPPSHRI